MSNEHGSWIMKGLGWHDPYRIRSWQELVNWIDEVGFLPLFANYRRDGYDKNNAARQGVLPRRGWGGDEEAVEVVEE